MPREAGIEHRTCFLLEQAVPGTKCLKQGRNGWPDRLVLLPGGDCFFIEFKAPGGRLRPDQLVVLKMLHDRQQTVLVIDSLADGTRLAVRARMAEADVLAGVRQFGATHETTISALRASGCGG